VKSNVEAPCRIVPPAVSTFVGKSLNAVNHEKGDQKEPFGHRKGNFGRTKDDFGCAKDDFGYAQPDEGFAKPEAGCPHP
jgi:hypothetical protein